MGSFKQGMGIGCGIMVAFMIVGFFSIVVFLHSCKKTALDLDKKLAEDVASFNDSRGE